MRSALIALALIAPVALSASGCALTGAISGNTSDCASAEKQLATAKASLALAQIALTSAEAFGNPPAILLAQTAVNTISADVTSIGALVTQSCAAPAPTAHMARLVVSPSPVITLADAKRLAAADQKLADALKSRGR